MTLLMTCSAISAWADEFQQSVQPLLKEYCNTCHSTQKQKGDLDLERFTSMKQVKADPAVWEHTLEQLANNEMPPKGKPQLSPEQKKLLTQWARGTLDELALASAGDPGPVVLRRLSNMEYTYTVRDLTGIDSLDPAKEFPVDGAAGEGFTNAGAALVMSPALLTKYLDAGKDIASHAVLLPGGMRFSESSSPRDWTDEALAKIRAFYARYTWQGGAESVNLQGVQFDTNTGGRLEVAKYLETLQGRGDASVLNARYLETLKKALESTQPSPVLDLLREKYKAKSLNALDVDAWQRVLWRFASVGHIGKKNGPKSWQEPVTPLGTHHEIRVKLEAPKEGGDAKLYLVSTDAGDGSADDEAIWENARVVVKDKPDVQVLASQAVKTPQVIEITVPAASIVKDTELVVTARHKSGSVQVQVLKEKPTMLSGLQSGMASAVIAKGQWSDNNLRTSLSAPILVANGSPARQKFEAAFDEFRALFPIALCYAKIVPVDEVVTLTLFHRDDSELQRLMLSAEESKELDRLWDELLFLSEAPLKQVDVFEQLWQFATQDAKPDAFEPMREPIMRGAEAFKKRLVEIAPVQVQAVLDFAGKAWRRSLSDREQSALRTLHAQLLKQGLSHPAATRMLLARVLTSPAFLYRGEKAAEGSKSAPVSDRELATRLSYFLWSSTPDAELMSQADAGRLHEPEVLVSQAHRMLKNAKVSRLATEFGCQWLQVRDVATLDEKSERHFPTFGSLRGPMQEEAERFFTALFQQDESVLSLLEADHTYVNGALAEHYGLKVKGSDWQRVEALRAQGRGGILGFAATLAKQSGASRTSPILRGNWLSEVVLGEKLPRPPKDVPILPEEAPAGLTERQLIERHSSDAACAKCHQRIDPFGFALEGFDAIGRSRKADTHAVLANGTTFEGLDGLRTYLLTTRRDDFLRQFCRKLLGYALGRSVQLSDKPLIETMITQLKANDFKITTALETILLSPQFREVRGRDFVVSQ
ncbi:hypothetical protein BGE01nite_43930 [Brevifollis gellanilyticus]|uniref:Cytochrome c n=2 Tax=Brevifollis gellanilyticus TaxID=748831 RepID=A0A512MEH9_9BACT|nr:hypothetical protein BGE01nite_43930 [Brevifollis gellanilyticus]